MINFSDKYDDKKFKLFLKQFLPEDLLEKNEVLEVDEGNEYFKKAILLSSVKSLGGLVVIEIERKRSEKSRITITKELFKFLNIHGYSKALVVTFSKKESEHSRIEFDAVETPKCRGMMTWVASLGCVWADRVCIDQCQFFLACLFGLRVGGQILH